jgi:glycerate kinase
MKVVIAPDSFKGGISARDAAAAIADGWRSVRPDDELVVLPQADGGEGTLDAVASSIPGAIRVAAEPVTGPDGRSVAAEYVRLPDGTAVVELAQSSGLALMAAPDPIGATTRGLGEMIAAALDAGAARLVVGLGGSASTDGGAGALDALGERAAPPGGVHLLTDVTAPLLGPRGAATVFGPQKGATPADIELLEERMRAWAAAHPQVDPATPGAGAAGGTAFGLLTLWHATVELGAARIADLTGLTAALRTADVLITGEGALDATSFSGKVVGHGLRAARAAAVSRVIAIAGRVSVDPDTLARAELASISLSVIAGSTGAALSDPARWLRRAGRLAAESF